MGKKVHPYGLRLGITNTWKSRWYAAGAEYVKKLHQDIKMKALIRKVLHDAGITDINVERFSDRVQITLFTFKPGVVIGRQGAALDELKDKIQTMLQTKNIDLKVEEIRKPEVVASAITNLIARQIEKRVPYRRACKQAIEKATESGVKGIKIKVGGRLNGTEIARSEIFSKGRIPLQTLRADIDYFEEPALTSYGKVGIKAWVYKGDVFADRKKLKTAKREEGISEEISHKNKTAVDSND